MKPGRFSHVAPRSLAQAVDVLSEHADDAKVLAGGQSLAPLLNMRLATPALLVDLNQVEDFPGRLSDHRPGEPLVIGAMTRQRDAEVSRQVRLAAPLVAEALPHVAHRAIRNRGTIGGSLAHADPAAELPAVALALDCQFTAVSARGTRGIPAAEFFQGYFTTALDPDELLVSVTVPQPRPGTTTAWREFAIREGDFPIVGVAVSLTVSEDGVVDDARVVLLGVADVPQRSTAAEGCLIGSAPSPATLQAAAAAAASGSSPSDDPMTSARYKRRLVQILTSEALQGATDRSGNR